MFEALKKHVENTAAQELETTRFFIQHGYCKNWSENECKEGDRGIQRYCTARRWEQYPAGEISREKIVELTTKRAEREKAKETAAKLEKIDRAAAAPDLQEVQIYVEWKRNTTWGNNPTAEITVRSARDWERHTGAASGCGYDKETAAVGTALNASGSVLKMLYTAKNAALERMTADEIAACKNGYVVESNRNYIAYGAGYGDLPYFEGGVGMSSFEQVFNACGFRLTTRHSTKHSDFYVFTRTEDAK